MWSRRRGVWINLRDRFPHPYAESDAVEYAAHIASQPVQTAFAIDVDGARVRMFVMGSNVRR